MKRLTYSQPIHVPGSTSNGYDYLCDVFDQSGGEKKLYAVAHGRTLEEAKERAVEIVRLERKNNLQLKLIREAYACLSSLNDGGFGPLTSKDDIDTMLKLGDILDDEGLLS